VAAKLTRLTHKIAIQLHLVAESYPLQFSLKPASSETFGYTLEFRPVNEYLGTHPPFVMKD